MKEGLKYVIELLEKRAARHKFMISGNYNHADKMIQYQHHCKMEECIAIRNSFKRKLRQIEKNHSSK